LSPVPSVASTERSPAPPAASEDPVGDAENDPGEESPRVCQPAPSGVRESSGSPPRRERERRRFEEEAERIQEVALLLTELEVRVVSPAEAQELRGSLGRALQTLIVYPHTNELSEVQLSGRPLLVLLRDGNTVRDAYRLLLSFVESSKPVPKPRGKSSLQSCGRSSVAEALRRGAVTGDRVLTLRHNAGIGVPEAQPPPSGSELSVERSGPADQTGAGDAGDALRRGARRRMDSLEETIRELENTLIEIGGHPTAEPLHAEAAARSGPARGSRRPAVPPEPPSCSAAPIQVLCLPPRHADSRSEAACSGFLSPLLLSGSLLELHLLSSDVCSLTPESSAFDRFF